MKLSIALSIALFTLGLNGCLSDKTPSPVNGHWALDMIKTLRNAEETGASKQSMSRLMQTFSGAHLRITDQELTLYPKGIDGPSLKMPYTLVSSDKNCSNVNIGKPGEEPVPQKFCVVEGQLEVTGFLSETREIYRRVL